ncbi:hypothetical protein [Mycobacterium sp. SP-6446]|uniref:hypothetical protein n=1 Tax=Mycobacterium sp. SP-6446 TaxID=1834162 RepID=UPI00096DE151|nr:hypothetical protein [Mycobacterium sp. SP-6446]OMC14956.1 hypothetical protein A5736_20455 [Mycobacterium sp. SP-6446]
MAFEPPQTTRQLRAVEVENVRHPPYLLKALDEPDTEWRLVAERPLTTMMPNPDKTGFLPQSTVFKIEDGTVKYFSPHDEVLIASVTARKGGDRQQIREMATGHGWHWEWLHEAGEDRDEFVRGDWTVEVIFYDQEDSPYEAKRTHPTHQTMPVTGQVTTTVLSWLAAAT